MRRRPARPRGPNVPRRSPSAGPDRPTLPPTHLRAGEPGAGPGRAAAATTATASAWRRRAAPARAEGEAAAKPAPSPGYRRFHRLSDASVKAGPAPARPSGSRGAVLRSGAGGGKGGAGTDYRSRRALRGGGGGGSAGRAGAEHDGKASLEGGSWRGRPECGGTQVWGGHPGVGWAPRNGGHPGLGCIQGLSVWGDGTQVLGGIGYGGAPRDGLWGVGDARTPQSARQAWGGLGLER